MHTTDGALEIPPTAMTAPLTFSKVLSQGGKNVVVLPAKKEKRK